MKAIYHIKASLLTLAAMVACTEMEINNESQDSTNNGLLQELSITGKDFQFEDATRSSVTIGESGASFTWNEDDVIGIFPDKGDQVSFAMAEGAGAQTATFSGGGWALKSSSKYAAYYPHVYENRDLTKIPVSYVGQTQNGNANTDHIGAYDFMAAGVSTPENGAVAFDMQHIGALVQLTVTVPEPSTLTKVVLTSTTEFTQTGTIDLTAEIPAITAETQSNTLEIVLNNVVTAEANEKVIVYFMTAPVDLTDSDLTVIVHFADETTSEVELTGKDFESGKAYKMAVDVKISRNYIDEYGENHGQGIKIGETVWAPVNCGYHKDNFKYGKLYQWGRKYGQGYKTDAILPELSKVYGSLDSKQTESYSNVFFIGSTSWLSSNETVWNSGTEDEPVKTEYDPCPKGWRVPTHAELTALSQNHSSWTTLSNDQKGIWFSGPIEYSSDVPQIFLPAAGERDYEEGYASYRNSDGYYWSSRSYNGVYLAWRLLFGATGTANIYCSENSDGHSLRCVQE